MKQVITKWSIITALGVFSSGIIHHELMHAMGFQHEQSRTDRDDFVVVDFSKITPGRFIAVSFNTYSLCQRFIFVINYVLEFVVNRSTISTI